MVLSTIVDTAKFHSYRNTVDEFFSSRRVMAILTILPAVLLFTFINVVPILWAVAAGFYRISPYSPDWVWVGLENYQAVIADPDFWNAVIRSLTFAGGSVVLQLVLGTALALLINRSFKFNALARAIIMLPYLIPTAVLGYIALWMGNSQWGIINQIFWQLGLIESYIPWYGDADTAMIALVLTNSWKFSIFVTIMVLARLQGIPDGFYEAAELAGASAYQKFRDITLPNLKGVIFIVLLLRAVWMFNKFDIIYVLTRGGPHDATTTVPIYAYELGFGRSLLGLAAAISTLLFIMLVGTAIAYFYVLEPSSEVRVE